MIFLSNGLLFSGANAPSVDGSVLIDGDRIAAVGALSAPADCVTIDCTGLAIAPGFIDLHSHADLQVLEDRPEKVKQGVTTEVVGNCGFSPFPDGGDPHTLREFGAGILGRPDGWGWSKAAEYLDAVEKKSTKVGVASLVGHGSLRVAVAGLRQDPVTPAALDRMAGMLAEALDAGCAGFSTGLMYAPGSSAGKEELECLCAVTARKSKLYATHMRGYGAGLVAATREQLDLALATGCRLQISHLQAAGRTNWGEQQKALDEIETARSQGIDVEFDIYPYQCGSTVLTQFLPQWALDGGTGALMARLEDPAIRQKMLTEMMQARSPLWSDITISAVQSPGNREWVGKTVADVAAARGRDAAETAMDLVWEERGAINIISFNQSEANLRQLLAHPLCSVISDGFYVTGKPHPRLHGTFPELLGTMVRERGWMPLAEAIHKVTAKPAARLGWTDRGRLEPGYRADVTIFDPATVQSRATYEMPERDPVGIVKVIRAGRIVHEGAVAAG
jgi:dihydroorotase/N-acyl-D-amino-acid deacylase